MVFENLTLVELHLENSRFDAGRAGESAGEHVEEEEAATESESGGRSLRGPLMLLVLLAVGGAMAARRRRKSSKEESPEAEQISIEQAAER